jgi:NAD(P)-dependent dehydrogenase (short-subunit alcohol dehydrogenase family)
MSATERSGRVQGKVALITGAGSGIGRATAELLAAEGASVVVTDIDPGAAEAVARDNGERSAYCTLDVADEEQWSRAIELCLERHGGLDILVNNAGIVLLKNLEKISLAEWRHQNAVNLDGVFLGTRFGIVAMKKRGGAIVNIASVAANAGIHTAAAYCASKGGVRSFTKAAALHCAHYKYPIRINSLHPGYIATPLLEGLARGRGDVDKNLQQLAAAHPIGHLGKPDDIAQGILYLVSDAAAFVTGSELIIDGGYLAQ